ncbi:SDR family NAD(P)-dependent oxidoreductase [Modestobacter roseus]|uniref:NAD(P)-dependent dehydrogenase (Short-subunit alcohol dehydrogenase family) n=1 Tax=Modestobacter roseus TaxID=1181884 RepID=A0A562IS44_9ACTN|nr:SDR family oxidoreductase [Modestobacter roseus]MQA35101.1 SDR family oxidoreductase [Modestobacter roseus]TWH73670.1 NAD(P)-dependent dehydrogenase (short-subunit alcohol dehydrogenase family) [Modestobacter roseus]
MRRLEGKTAIVTGGGTQGIGRAAAARLVSEGAHVFIVGRRRTELEEAVRVIGPEVTAVPGDITDPADLDRLFEAVAARGRGLDVLFANAATASFATIETITAQDLDQVFRVNVVGTVLTVQKALPVLNEGASVIVNASTAADHGAVGFGAYAASKAALRALTRTWANELKGRGIRVNAISPGPIDTSGITELVGEANAAAHKASEGARIAIGRIGRPEEVAAAVAFLASADSSFMLGANLYVDGGENQI